MIVSTQESNLQYPALAGRFSTTDPPVKLNNSQFSPTEDTNIYAWVIQYRGYTFYVSHYPTLTSNLDNDAPLKKHVINLYGHTHQKTNFYQDTPFMYHVGLDSHDCYPVEIETIIADIHAKVDECKAMLGEGETDESCN